MVRTGHLGTGQISHNDIIVPYIESYASEELKKKYLPGCVSGDIITAVGMTEPDAGSDLASLKTTAVEDGDEVIINGSKIFISNGINCDLVVLAARDPEVANPYEALSLYLVEAALPGFEKGKKLEKMGIHQQDTSELFFNDCRVPKKNMIGKKGAGFKMLMEKLQQERLVVAIFGINAAEYILDLTLKYYKNNSGPGKAVPKSQANQFALVEMATEVKIGRTFLDKLVADHVEKRNVVVETSMAKFWGTDLAKRVADRCFDLFGDAAAINACPITRMALEARAACIYAGTNEIMKLIVAKFMGI